MTVRQKRRNIAVETADTDSLNPGAESGGTEYGVKAGAASETPLLGRLFTYEIENRYWRDEIYLVITGIAGEYRDNFRAYMAKVRDSVGSWRSCLGSGQEGRASEKVLFIVRAVLTEPVIRGKG